MQKHCTTPGCTFPDFHNSAHSFEINYTRRCVPCVHEEVGGEVCEEVSAKLYTTKRLSTKQRNLMMCRSALTIKDLHERKVQISVQKKTYYSGIVYVVFCDETTASTGRTAASRSYYLSSSSYLKRALDPSIYTTFWDLLATCNTDKFDEWEELAIDQYILEEEQCIFKCAVCAFGTNKKAWATRHAGERVGHYFVGIEPRSRPEQEEPLFKKPRGRVPRGKEWDYLNGKWVEVCSEEEGDEDDEDDEDDEYDEYDEAAIAQAWGAVDEFGDEPIQAGVNEEAIGEYTSASKKSHRFTFATYCEEAALVARSLDILYLESADGDATVELLKHFNPSQLHPCNHDEDVTKILKSKFPGVSVEFGDIYDIYNKQLWLGVWFDTEETWKKSNGSEWNVNKIPLFHQAHVIAVTLSTRHAVNKIASSDLDHLFAKEGCHIQEHSRGYIGKGGKMNMTFGIATFNEPYMMVPEPLPVDFMFSHLRVPVEEFGDLNGKQDYNVVNGCFVATVSRVVEDGIYITFQSNNQGIFFFAPAEDKYTIDQIKRWRVM